MKDCLKINITREGKNEKGAVMTYELTSKFSNEYVFIGKSTFHMYTTTGAIDWKVLITKLSSIIDALSSVPNIKSLFLSDIPLEITFEEMASELFASFNTYKEIMGSQAIVEILKQFMIQCNEHKLIPTINGIDLESILPLK